MIRLRPLLFASLLVSAVTLQSAPPADTSHLGASSAPAELYAAAKPLRIVSARHAEARRLFEWAAAAGHVPSMLELAEMLGAGQGGERIEKVKQVMNAETARLRDETAKTDATLKRVREANSPEARQRMGDRIGAGMDFVAGKRAYESGDIEKARELWTGAAAAGHAEAAERLKALPPPRP